MLGGRPKNDVWQLFDTADDGVKYQRCFVEIQNPKVIKLESHLLQCTGYTLREKKNRKRVEEERAEERARRKSLDGGATFAGPLSGCEAVVDSPSQAEVDQLIAIFVYEAGLAFRVVEMTAFRRMIHGCNPSLTVPSAKAVGGTLLDSVYKAQREKIVLVLCDQPFIGLAFDGWSNEKTINMVAVAPNMTIYLKPIAVGFDSETGQDVADLILKEIDELEEIIGKGKVATCTSDNVGNMVNAWEHLEKAGILCNDCAAHSFNLLLQDVAKLEDIKRVANGAEEITAYFMEHPRLLARFVAEKKAVAQANSSNTHGRSFTIAVATRWYSFYQCLVNVIRNRDAVVNVLDDDEFMKSYKDTKKRRTVSTKAPKKTKRVSKSVKSKSRKVRANEAQDKKSPKQLAFEKIVRHVRDEKLLGKGKRDWTPKQRKCEKRTAPLEWWGEERDKYPILFRIARRAFTMPTSSAASERNWSTHKYIYSDRRVHLGLKNERAYSLYWNHMEKGLPDVVFDPSTLGEEAVEMAGITFEEGYEEDDIVSSCSDDDDGDVDSSDEDDAGSEEEGTQEAMNYAADYSFDFQGE